jgi:hypothetical protein
LIKGLGNFGRIHKEKNRLKIKGRKEGREGKHCENNNNKTKVTKEQSEKNKIRLEKRSNK